MKDYKFTISARDKTKAAFKSVKRGLRGVRAGVNSTYVQMGVLAGAAGLGAVIQSSLKYADELGKVSDRLDITTQDLAAFHHQTQLNGGSATDFEKGLEKMSRGIGEAERGFGTAKKGLETLGVSLDQLKGKDSKEKFLIIADGIKGLKSEAQKASVAADIFGRSGIKLLNTLDKGREGFESAAEEAEMFGLAISRIDAAKAEAANDELLRSQQAIKGIGIRVTTQLAPYITAVTKQFTQFVVESTKGSDWIVNAIDGVGTAVGVMADGIHGVKLLWQGAKVAGVGFATAVLGALKLVLDGVAHLGNSIKDFYMKGLRPVIEFGNKVGVVGDDVLNTFNSIDENFQFRAPQIITNSFDEMVVSLATQKTQLDADLAKPLPSIGIKNAMEQIKIEAYKASEAINLVAQKKLAEGDSREKDADEVKKIETKLERLKTSYLTEIQLLNQKQEAEMQILRDAKEAMLIDEQEFGRRKLEIEAKFYAKRKKAQEDADKSEASGKEKLNKLKEILGKKGEAATKISSLKETISNTHAGAMGAYKALASIPIIGPALGAAAYLKVMKTGLKSQAGISSGSMGGASAPSSSSSDSADVASFSQPTDISEFKSTQEQTDKRAVIQIMGDVNSNDAPRLLEDIRNLINEHDHVLIDPNSRNAQDLLAGA